MRRRDFLRAGLASLSLADVLALRARAGLSPSDERTALLVVWLQGGASHLETYDPKPDAPAEIRGPFGSIPTRVEGVRISELLPGHARVADKFSILRSLAHSGFCHQQGNQQMFTGHPVQVLKLKPDHPDLMCIAHQERADPDRRVPVYVGVNPIPYLGSAYLGPAFEPFGVLGDPNAPGFTVPGIGLDDPARIARLEGRNQLAACLDGHHPATTTQCRGTPSTLRCFPAPGVRAADRLRGSAGLRPRPGGPPPPGSLRPQHLGPALLAGAPAGRGGR